PYIRVFAGLYPDEVAGMVLVDPTQEELVAWAKTRPGKTSAEHQPRPYDEVDCAPAALAQAHESQVPHVPVVLITGMGPRVLPSLLTSEQRQEALEDFKTAYPQKLKFHKEWLEKIPNGQLIITEKSGHGIPFEEPELVIGAIRQIVEQVRSHP